MRGLRSPGLKTRPPRLKGVPPRGPRGDPGVGEEGEPRPERAAVGLVGEPDLRHRPRGHRQQKETAGGYGSTSVHARPGTPAGSPATSGSLRKCTSGASAFHAASSVL